MTTPFNPPPTISHDTILIKLSQLSSSYESICAKVRVFPDGKVTLTYNAFPANAPLASRGDARLSLGEKPIPVTFDFSRRRCNGVCVEPKSTGNTRLATSSRSHPIVHSNLYDLLDGTHLTHVSRQAHLGQDPRQRTNLLHDYLVSFVVNLGKTSPASSKYALRKAIFVHKLQHLVDSDEGSKL
jgi:hypothetical protein